SEKVIFRLLLALSVVLMIVGSAIQYWATQDDLRTKRTHFAGNDDLIPAVLVQPKSEGPFPAIVLLHGYGSRKELVLPTALELGKAGFKVLVPDLRGHGDYARTPSDFGGKERFDVVTAIDYLISMQDVDSTKIALMGSSYGAMNALIAGGIDNRVKTVVSSSSPSNLTRWLQEKDWDGEERHSYVPHREIVDNHEEQNYRSPIAYVDKIPSVLLFHGAADQLVPVSHAKELYSLASNTSRLQIISGAEHDLPREVVLPEAIEWLGEHLGVEISRSDVPIRAYSSISGMGIFYLGLGFFIIVSSHFFHAIISQGQVVETFSNQKYNFQGITALWGVTYVLITVGSLILANEAEFENVTRFSLLFSKLVLGIMIAGFMLKQSRARTNSGKDTALNRTLTQGLARFLLINLCILCIWVFHAFLARLLFYPFSDIAVVAAFPEIYCIIIIAAVVDEFWFRQVFQEHILENTRKFSDKKIIALSSLFYLVAKVLVVFAIEFYFDLLTFRWLIAIFAFFLFIGIAGAILKKKQGLGAAVTFSILVHSTVYVALALTIFL
ncbi:MAG: alpha/beta hydrolase family protein, partial [Candidatus Hodarchaeota archaeon]